MNSMNNVAFGAGKTGAAFDPITYLTRPQVILRIICWLCSIIVWCCISFNAWHRKGRKEFCLYNNDNAACRFGSTIGFIGFLAATAFLVLEAIFQNLSSIKLRRRAVLVDAGFSASWSILYLIVFGYLGIAWGKADYPYLGNGINNCRAAIVFSFFSIAAWGACAYLAHARWQQGADMTEFTSGFDPSAFNNNNNMGVPGGGDGYTAGYGQQQSGTTAADMTANNNYQQQQYTTANDNDPNYHSNPFTAMATQESNVNYQQPSY
ncbi:synaptogyrin [Dermatophagoides farinae]|uniref:Synaptogyrin n=1 Tax=Dermatophagoides farinae TaxID=6954 RepID=A0A922KY15_DERFA|nr:synaptogyrin-like isoform X2 [Dermatophagoides farinae]KAH7637516.1 synaptogyrin-3-like protein [Dermatophagoides farinae]KAH9502009.1 Synaptogyrin-1 [Dermatophagoides farinae]